MEDLGKLGKVAVAWKERLKEGWGQPSLPAKVYQQHPAASLKHPFEKGLRFEKKESKSHLRHLLNLYPHPPLALHSGCDI